MPVQLYNSCVISTLLLQQNEQEYVLVTSDDQTEAQRIQIVGEVEEGDLSEAGQYILLNEDNEKIMVQIDGVNSALPVSFEGATVVSSEEMVSFISTVTIAEFFKVIQNCNTITLLSHGSTHFLNLAHYAI